MKNNIEQVTSSDIKKEICNLSQLVFEMTDRCNLKCTYCGYGEFYASYDERKAQDLSFDRAKILIDYLVQTWRENGIESRNQMLTIGFYGGEPLLNVPVIRQIQTYIEEEYSVIITPNYSMTTNAVLLDKYMDFIVSKNVQLLISLDGDEKGHSYRVDHNQKNSFERVFRNIKLLQQKYLDYFEKKVSFNAVLHDRNHTQDIYDFIKQNYGKTPQISQLNNSGIREDKKEEFNRMFNDKQTDFYRSKDIGRLTDEMFYDVADNKELYAYIEAFSGNIYKHYADLFIDTSKLSKRITGTCNPFAKKMYLTVNGKLLACERIDQKFVLGHVTENGVTLDFEKIARQYNHYFSLLKNQCEKCYRASFCRQCIFYLPISENSIVCDSFMNKHDFDLYVQAQKSYLRRNPHIYLRFLDDLVIY